MGRRLTIRGTFDITANDRPKRDLVFAYESPDRTKGWKITGAWQWMNPKEDNITSNNNPALYGCLATDTLENAVAPMETNDIQTAGDNRIVAWHQVHMRGFDTGDYFVLHAATLPESAFLLDLERIVTNDLYIYSNCLANGGGDQTDWQVNYMIALEEVTLTPSQSVLQQLKGIGQDINE
jgi:hypothetical protein